MQGGKARRTPRPLAAGNEQWRKPDEDTARCRRTTKVNGVRRQPSRRRRDREQKRQSLPSLGFKPKQGRNWRALRLFELSVFQASVGRQGQPSTALDAEGGVVMKNICAVVTVVVWSSTGCVSGISDDPSDELVASRTQAVGDETPDEPPECGQNMIAVSPSFDPVGPGGSNFGGALSRECPSLRSCSAPTPVFRDGSTANPRSTAARSSGQSPGPLPSKVSIACAQVLSFRPR
jgi:hypothetical protein